MVCEKVVVLFWNCKKGSGFILEGWNLDICYIFYINGISVRAHWLGFLWLFIMSIDIEYML